MTDNSKTANSFVRKLAKFGRNKSGQVALTFGLAAVPLFGVAGIAVDYGRKVEAQSVTQAAIDGAAMAATAALNAGENQAAYKKAAQDFFNRNKPDNLIGNPEVSVTVDFENGTLVAETDAAIPTTMMKILGFNSMPLTNNNQGGGAGGGSFGTTVSIPAFTLEKKGEIVMVMDYSGSMNWYLGGEKKYKTMRNEAAKLVSALSQGKTNQYVKFGVVPFSSEVYPKMKKKFWYGFKGNQMRSSCTRDRRYPYNLEVSTPTNPGDKTNITRFGWVQSEGSSNPNSFWFNTTSNGNYYNYRNSCSAYPSRNLKIQDLSKDHDTTYNKILAMRPYGNTHIAVGMEFGYQLLSPNAPYDNGVAFNTPGVEKAVILLTDGAQTTKAFGAGYHYGVDHGEANLATLCTNMKNNGIRILTVSYDLYNATTENRLRDCATDSNDFYDADTKGELVSAFSNITAKLARDMYLAK